MEILGVPSTNHIANPASSELACIAAAPTILAYHKLRMKLEDGISGFGHIVALLDSEASKPSLNRRGCNISLDADQSVKARQGMRFKQGMDNTLQLTTNDRSLFHPVRPMRAK